MSSSPESHGVHSMHVPATALDIHEANVAEVAEHGHAPAGFPPAEDPHFTDQEWQEFQGRRYSRRRRRRLPDGQHFYAGPAALHDHRDHRRHLMLRRAAAASAPQRNGQKEQAAHVQIDEHGQPRAPKARDPPGLAREQIGQWNTDAEEAEPGEQHRHARVAGPAQRRREDVGRGQCGLRQSHQLQHLHADRDDRRLFRLGTKQTRTSPAPRRKTPLPSTPSRRRRVRTPSNRCAPPEPVGPRRGSDRPTPSPPCRTPLLIKSSAIPSEWRCPEPLWPRRPTRR